MPNTRNRARRAAAMAMPVLIILAVLLGCRGRPIDTPPGELLGRTWYNQSQPTADLYPDPNQAIAAGLDAAFGNAPRPTPPPLQVESRPLNVVVLSAGGKYTAFAVGVLAGWTASGTRPMFDVVTGVSGGALAAPYALLGPKYDQRMTDVFLTTQRRDLFRIRPLTEPFHSCGLATNRPFRRLLEREVNDETLADLRAAHAEGRRVFVATGNRVTFRAAIWDLGAVASSSHPQSAELTRDILLAAASHPAIAPPVEFYVTVNGVRYTELHQDAGNIMQAFVHTGRGLPPGSNVYVITAGKLFRTPMDRRGGLIRTASAAASNTLYSLHRADVLRIYALCAVSRARFHLIDLPAEVTVQPASMSFDSDDMRKLYDIGYKMAQNGVPWQTTFPESQPGETLRPRTGLDFVVP